MKALGFPAAFNLKKRTFRWLLTPTPATLQLVKRQLRLNDANSDGSTDPISNFHHFPFQFGISLLRLLLIRLLTCSAEIRVGPANLPAVFLRRPSGRIALLFFFQLRRNKRSHRAGFYVDSMAIFVGPDDCCLQNKIAHFYDEANEPKMLQSTQFNWMPSRGQFVQQKAQHSQ